MVQTKPVEYSTDIYDWQEKHGKKRFWIIFALAILALATAIGIMVFNKLNGS